MNLSITRRLALRLVGAPAAAALAEMTGLRALAQTTLTEQSYACPSGVTDLGWGCNEWGEPFTSDAYGDGDNDPSTDALPEFNKCGIKFEVFSPIVPVSGGGVVRGRARGTNGNNTCSYSLAMGVQICRRGNSGDWRCGNETFSPTIAPGSGFQAYNPIVRDEPCSNGTSKRWWTRMKLYRVDGSTRTKIDEARSVKRDINAACPGVD